MSNHRAITGQCNLCHAEKPQRDLVPAEFVRPALARMIEREHPQWRPEGFICAADLNRYRMAYVREVLQTEVGEISALEAEVIESLKKNEVLSANVYAGSDARSTRGEWLADRIAAFGGRWRFLLLF